ncbi:phosphomannose isomerase type II C-terminal cupin domain [Aquabacterium sp.]|uniref:phosphomannose isomerase type II C-terminal cupin domain n=1 Tax=Aquabacterium sp. TaxID=1872578 RepID=UPI00378406C4
MKLQDLPRAEARPWGHFEVLATMPAVKIKCIVVQAGLRLSLQRHRLRHEHWYVVEGLGAAEVDATRVALGPGQAIDIPAGVWHRLSNTGDRPLVLIEIQTGSGLCESDIERAEDDFGRHQLPPPRERAA